MSEPIDDTRIKEMLRLVESDHKATTEYIARLATLRTAARGVIVPLASGLAGLALANQNWVVAIVAIPTVAIGAISEARSDFLLKIAHNRLLRLEYKVQAYLTYLNETGTVAADAKLKLDREIDTYQFGISRSLRGQSLKKTLTIASRTVMFWLYVTLIVALVVIGVVVGLVHASSKAEVDACLVSKRGTIVEVHELPSVRAGSIELVPCPHS
jgi:hypothetical protein